MLQSNGRWVVRSLVQLAPSPSRERFVERSFVVENPPVGFLQFQKNFKQFLWLVDFWDDKPVYLEMRKKKKYILVIFKERWSLS